MFSLSWLSLLLLLFSIKVFNNDEIIYIKLSLQFQVNRLTSILFPLRDCSYKNLYLFLVIFSFSYPFPLIFFGVAILEHGILRQEFPYCFFYSWLTLLYNPFLGSFIPQLRLLPNFSYHVSLVDSFQQTFNYFWLIRIVVSCDILLQVLN